MFKNYYPEEIKQKAIKLRGEGFTYTEIQQLINYPVPKNTFTGWFKNIILSNESKERISRKIIESGGLGLSQAWANIKCKREKGLRCMYARISNEITDIDKTTSKIILATLYAAEGGKTNECISFGNSDPKLINLFLFLLRKNFPISEQKFRGRVQCRMDQDVSELEKFWSDKTDIPLNQFQKTSIDKRTQNKPTKKSNYKGVFVLTYYSSTLFLELKFISDIIYELISAKGL